MYQDVLLTQLMVYLYCFRLLSEFIMSSFVDVTINAAEKTQRTGKYNVVSLHLICLIIMLYFISFQSPHKPRMTKRYVAYAEIVLPFGKRRTALLW